MRRTNPVPSPYQGRCTLGFHAKIRGCTRDGVKLVLSWYGFDPWMDTPKREQIASTSWCSCWVVCRLFPSSPPSDPMPIFGYFYFGNPRTNWENRAGENGRTLDVMGVEKCVWFSSIYSQSPFATSSVTRHLLPFLSPTSSCFQWLAAPGYPTKGRSGRQYGYYSLGVYLCSLG